MISNLNKISRSFYFCQIIFKNIVSKHQEKGRINIYKDNNVCITVPDDLSSKPTINNSKFFKNECSISFH